MDYIVPIAIVLLVIGLCMAAVIISIQHDNNILASSKFKVGEWAKIMGKKCRILKMWVERKGKLRYRIRVIRGQDLQPDTGLFSNGDKSVIGTLEVYEWELEKIDKKD